MSATVASVASALNFRDLGGLPTEDGRWTRPGLLYRAGAFNTLSPLDAGCLHHELGIRFVVDLRGAEESAVEGRGALGELPVCHLNLPLMDFSYLLEAEAADGDALMPRYLENLESDPNLVVAVDLVAHALQREPAVLHCAFGKDRTGTVIALLLRMAGVTTEAVVADYMASGPHAERFVEVARQIPRYRPYADRDTSVFYCQEETIRLFLAELERRYGGATRWARAKGITAATIDGLRAALVGPALET